MNTVTRPQRTTLPWQRILVVLIVLAALVGVAGTGYYYVKYRNLSQDKAVVERQESEKIIASVSRLVEVPKGEDPTVATITDVSKLAEQTFFKSAKNGDKLLMYSNAKKAVIYRPSTDKIVNIGPIN